MQDQTVWELRAGECEVTVGLLDLAEELRLDSVGGRITEGF